MRYSYSERGFSCSSFICKFIKALFLCSVCVPKTCQIYIMDFKSCSKLCSPSLRLTSRLLLHASHRLTVVKCFFFFFSHFYFQSHYAICSHFNSCQGRSVCNFHSMLNSLPINAQPLQGGNKRSAYVCVFAGKAREGWVPAATADQMKQQGQRQLMRGAV